MSKPEDLLAFQMKTAGIRFQREFRAIPGRRFKWDFYVEGKLLVEVQGGVFITGAHSTGVGITRDCEKLTLATINGYSQIAVTPAHVRDGRALGWIQKFMRLNHE